MLAAAVGRTYRINYGGTSVFHHADDMAAVFIRAVRANGEGAPVFDVGGTVATMEETVAAIAAAAPESVGKISHDTPPLAVTIDIDGQPLERLLGPIHWTPLTDGVRATVEHFRTAAKAGKVDADKILA
jgi:nucleoside-diphosphate-sugar epimerase